MENYENEIPGVEFVPEPATQPPEKITETPVEESAAVQPIQPPVKTSPFADSPYVMNHPPVAEKVEEPVSRKPEKKSGGMWKKVISAVLILPW